MASKVTIFKEFGPLLKKIGIFAPLYGQGLFHIFF
jgi:hypothetical protein